LLPEGLKEDGFFIILRCRLTSASDCGPCDLLEDVGSGIGSISSPFKAAMATPLVDAVGQEGDILRETIPIGVGISLITGIWSYILLYILP